MAASQPSQRPRHAQPHQQPQPTWQPISMLPVIAHLIDGTLASAEEQHATLQEIRHRPYVLDDATVARTRRVYTETADDLSLYEEQLARWKRTNLTAVQWREIERLAGQLARLRTVVAAILALADELAQGTIERVLAKSDIELGLEFLPGQMAYGRTP